MQQIFGVASKFYALNIPNILRGVSKEAFDSLFISLPPLKIKQIKLCSNFSLSLLHTAGRLLFKNCLCGPFLLLFSRKRSAEVTLQI